MLPGRFPNGVNVAVGDVDADNYDDIIVSAGAGREAIITALSGRDIVDGVADPARIFTFVAPRRTPRWRQGGRWLRGTLDGAKLQAEPDHDSGAWAGMSARSPCGIRTTSPVIPIACRWGGMAWEAMPHDTTSTDEPPMPVTTFRPFGTRRGAVNLATTYQRQLGGQAQAVVAAWQTPREVAFTAIGLDNTPQSVKRRF